MCQQVKQLLCSTTNISYSNHFKDTKSDSWQNPESFQFHRESCFRERENVTQDIACSLLEQCNVLCDFGSLGFLKTKLPVLKLTMWTYWHLEMSLLCFLYFRLDHNWAIYLCFFAVYSAEETAERRTRCLSVFLIPAFVMACCLPDCCFVFLL